MEQIISTFGKFQAQLDQIENMLEQMKDRLSKVGQPPQCIPFITLEELLNFQHVDEATYDNVMQ
ncbi:uncharacterized protein LOC105828845 [Monomorium pharaonis]|uniref:uncharacterized protein LOC105828845 n=1 Tax=Monomorium pharaonis TaxID=307658 RepID=UPI00063F18DB|nr:uncharacterized protein LOC105828845 [Monomorium pharaonis]